jgi:hypothetical protein
VVFFARFPAESDASVSHDSIAIRDIEVLISRTWAPAGDFHFCSTAGACLRRLCCIGGPHPFLAR